MKHKIEGGKLQKTELQESVEMHNREKRDPFYDRELDVKHRVVDRNLRPVDRTGKCQKAFKQ